MHHFLPDLRCVKDGADEHGNGGGNDDNCRKNGGDLNDEDTGDVERTVGVRVRRNYIRYCTFLRAVFYRVSRFDLHPFTRSCLGNIFHFFLNRRVFTLRQGLKQAY